VERRALRRLTALVFVLAVAGGGAWYAVRRARPQVSQGHPAAARADAPKPIVPAGVRIRVEVVNATTVRGLARRATFYLRDLGFDVVSIRNATARELRDSTLVIDRAGKAEWAKLLSGALGNARVDTQADTSRYVDATVLLGATWRPPAQPFYP
jgi:hypothetical protein